MDRRHGEARQFRVAQSMLLSALLAVSVVVLAVMTVPTLLTHESLTPDGDWFRRSRHAKAELLTERLRGSHAVLSESRVESIALQSPDRRGPPCAGWRWGGESDGSQSDGNEFDRSHVARRCGSGPQVCHSGWPNKLLCPLYPRNHEYVGPNREIRNRDFPPYACLLSAATPIRLPGPNTTALVPMAMAAPRQQILSSTPAGHQTPYSAAVLAAVPQQQHAPPQQRSHQRSPPPQQWAPPPPPLPPRQWAPPPAQRWPPATAVPGAGVAGAASRGVGTVPGARDVQPCQGGCMGNSRGLGIPRQRQPRTGNGQALISGDGLQVRQGQWTPGASLRQGQWAPAGPTPAGHPQGYVGQSLGARFPWDN